MEKPEEKNRATNGQGFFSGSMVAKATTAVGYLTLKRPQETAYHNSNRQPVGRKPVARVVAKKIKLAVLLGVCAATLAMDYSVFKLSRAQRQTWKDRISYSNLQAEKLSQKFGTDVAVKYGGSPEGLARINRICYLSDRAAALASARYHFSYGQWSNKNGYDVYNLAACQAYLELYKNAPKSLIHRYARRQTAFFATETVAAALAAWNDRSVDTNKCAEIVEKLLSDKKLGKSALLGLTRAKEFYTYGALPGKYEGMYGNILRAQDAAAQKAAAQKKSRWSWLLFARD